MAHAHTPCPVILAVRFINRLGRVQHLGMMLDRHESAFSTHFIMSVAIREMAHTLLLMLQSGRWLTPCSSCSQQTAARAHLLQGALDVLAHFHYFTNGRLKGFKGGTQALGGLRQ